jgi:beta-lactamase class A
MKTLIVSIVALLSFANALHAQTPQRPSQAPLDRLRTNIEQIAKSVDTNWGIYIRCLDTNEEVAINADRVMDTMSVIKLPLMVEAFRQIEAGKFSLDDRYSLRTSDRRPGTGILRRLEDGASLTIKDLLTLMIIVSDNTATDTILRAVYVCSRSATSRMNAGSSRRLSRWGSIRKNGQHGNPVSTLRSSHAIALSVSPSTA